MWKITNSDDAAYFDRVKAFTRKHAAEFAELFKRLKLLCQYLDSGMPVRDALGVKWVHHKYRMGMKSLAGGGRKGQAALRLYVYPDAERKTVVILGVGDKGTQGKDVEKAEKVLTAYMAKMAANEQDGRQDGIQTIQNG